VTSSDGFLADKAGGGMFLTRLAWVSLHSWPFRFSCGTIDSG